MGSLINLLIELLIFGVVIWALQYVLSLLPIDAAIKQIINVVIVVIAIIWILKTLLGFV